jgi:hypothetical protein
VWDPLEINAQLRRNPADAPSKTLAGLQGLARE